MDIAQVKALVLKTWQVSAGTLRDKYTCEWTDSLTQKLSRKPVRSGLSSNDCYFCGGKVTAQRVNVMRHWKGRYILIENVDAHICTQCGERYYDATVAEAMDQIMRTSESELSVKREIRVPVIEMPLVYATPQQTGLTIQDKPSE